MLLIDESHSQIYPTSSTLWPKVVSRTVWPVSDASDIRAMGAAAAGGNVLPLAGLCYRARQALHAAAGHQRVRRAEHLDGRGQVRPQDPARLRRWVTRLDLWPLEQSARDGRITRSLSVTCVLYTIPLTLMYWLNYDFFALYVLLLRFFFVMNFTSVHLVLVSCTDTGIGLFPI